jgi:hypothetical protein
MMLDIFIAVLQRQNWNQKKFVLSVKSHETSRQFGQVLNLMFDSRAYAFFHIASL